MWQQGLAISALLASGIAIFVMSTSTMRSLELNRERYYRDYRFGDVFVQMVRAPNQLAERLAEIPGVERIQTRIVREVLLDMPNMVEPASCRLVSVDDQPALGLNGVHLRRGRFPNSIGPTEVVISELFADAHGLNPGDELHCIMGGRRQKLTIVGVGLSPEYVYAVQPGLLLTDNRRFGIVWMPRPQMAAAFNMEGAFNNVSMILRPNVSVDAVLMDVDRLTAAYGSIGAYGREDQESHNRVSDEMHQIRTMAYVTPSIFLVVAAFLFNIVFSRLINQQKEQIATLRAFGYRASEIGLHYVKFIALLVAVGSVAGWIIGIRFSWWMNSLYAHFFRLPTTHNEFAYTEAVLAVLASFVVALLGGYSAIRRAMYLPPAVAMRPESPKPKSGMITEWIGLTKILSPLSRMIVRRLESNSRSTILSVFGMGLGLSVLVLGSFMEDTIDYVIDFQFQRAQRQQVMLTFNESLSASAMHDVRHLPGVFHAEPFRAVPVRLRSGPRWHRLSLMGLNENPSLYRVLDDHARPIRLPEISGLTISKKLAEILSVKVGDEIVVEILEGRRATRLIRITEVFANFTDPGAYMYRPELHRMLNEGEQLSGAFLAVDMDQMDLLFAAVKETPTIAGVLDKQAALDNFRNTMSESTSIMRTVNATFASIIAFGVIYNCAMITLAERARDLATLRVIGFSRREVSVVLLGELAIITLLAIPIGLPIGYGLSYLTTLALDTETHRFPLVVSRATFAYATVVILLAATFSSLYVLRLLDKLDLISVLKVKE
jgi:putative ABC transport system permease protein